MESWTFAKKTHEEKANEMHQHRSCIELRTMQDTPTKKNIQKFGRDAENRWTGVRSIGSLPNLSSSLNSFLLHINSDAPNNGASGAVFVETG